jgi:hypothetical protein
LFEPGCCRTPPPSSRRQRRALARAHARIRRERVNAGYRRPDHAWLLQTYVWQAYDLCPEFPELQGFLEF